ncbi:MAG: OadG family protein [Candidatus Margulisbacteria bacterium]|jgi:sodium pump decarboxylase gamma subunit|nr:OadG family protein [Candidatus Margulisiibacteriota bacterium]
MWFSAVRLTVVGMGVTFIFLLIMVWAISLLGAVAARFFTEPAVLSGGGEETEIVAAIAAAVTSLQ